VGDWLECFWCWLLTGVWPVIHRGPAEDLDDLFPEQEF